VRVAILHLKAVSILNQAALVEKLLRDRGYDVEYRRGITAWEIRDEELKALLIMTVAAPAHVCEYIFPFHYAKRDVGKPVALYVTIEGIPYKAAIQGSGLERLEYIANSEFTAECLRKVGLNVIDVIHHAVDMDLAKKVTYETERRRNPFDRFLERRFGDICKLIYVGRHDPRKGLPLLAEAMKIVHEKWRDKYVLVMISEPGAKKYFEGLNVYWLTNFGNLTYEHTLMAMKACDYLVFPSLCEGFGLPVLEANSLGIPAIHSWFEPLSEFSSQEFNFVFNYLLERPMKTRSGQFFIMHEYVPDMLADMIDYALEVFYNSREEYEDYSAKAVEHASKWDYRLIYPRLLEHLEVE